MIGMYRIYWSIKDQLKLTLASGGRFLPWSLKFPFPQVLLFDCCWHEDPAFREYVGKARNAGTQIWGMQHGGGYGMLADIPKERVEREICDRWFGWGWAEENMPSPWMTFPDRGTLKRDGIWLVVGPDKLLDHIIGVRVRPYPDVPDKVEFRKFLDKSRLVIVDYCGTSLIEAMAADVPTLCYWDAEKVRLRPEAEAEMECLRQVGIWHPSLASVKETLRHLEIETWWASNEVRTARNHFVQKYARGQKDWITPWLDLANKLEKE